MPLYQYRGLECDHVFEVRQSFSDDPVSECDVCGKPVRRVIHASPVVFKGSGWYVTDSRPTSDPIGGVQDTSKKAAADTPSKTTDTDSKPAAKTEPASTTATAN